MQNPQELREMMRNRNMVIARVWYSKNGQGERVNAKQVIKDGGNVGHASLQIFQQGQLKLYISFWPSKTPKTPVTRVPATMNTLLDDHQDEHGPPDVLSYLVNVDGQRIMNAFFEFLKNTNSRPTYKLVPSSRIPVVGSILYEDMGGNGENCCSIVFGLLIKGLINLDISNDILSCQIRQINLKRLVTPNMLGDFFKFFSEHENRTFKALNIVEYKQNFVDLIKQKMRVYADRDARGELEIYRRTYPQVYSLIESDLLQRKINALKKIESEINFACKSKDIPALVALRKENPRTYSQIEHSMDEEIKNEVAKEDKKISTDEQAQSNKVKHDLQTAAGIFISELSKYIPRNLGYDKSAETTLVTSILNALRKGLISDLITNPHNYNIPRELSPFMFNYLYENPTLLLAAEYPNEAKEVEVYCLTNPQKIYSNAQLLSHTHFGNTTNRADVEVAVNIERNNASSCKRA